MSGELNLPSVTDPDRLVMSRGNLFAVTTTRGNIAPAGARELGVFFQDLSNRVLQDDVLARLLTFPNVVVTSHQAFLTREALANIARVTLENVSVFERGEPLRNEVRADQVLAASPGRG